MKLLDVAISQIGVTEDAAHTNHGEAVKYQIAAGLPKGGGFPWCQSFVFWCGLTAYGDKNPVPKTGGVLDCWHKAVANTSMQKIIKSMAASHNILPGYQFVYDHGKGLGHTGIVEKMYEDGSFDTIEGNSNDAGGRDGYEVAHRTGTNRRHLTDPQLVGFICYKDPVNPIV